MEAIVVGKKDVDFVDADKNPVKMMKYYLNMPGENVEGYEVGTVTWNKMRSGAAPEIGLGEVIEVEYNKNGRLKFPSPKLTAAEG